MCVIAAIGSEAEERGGRATTRVSREEKRFESSENTVSLVEVTRRRTFIEQRLEFRVVARVYVVRESSRVPDRRTRLLVDSQSGRGDTPRRKAARNS